MGTYDTIGGTPRHDPSMDMDPPCEVCGKPVDECECMPCPQCGVVGCPLHGIKVTPHRKKRRKHKMRNKMANARWHLKKENTPKSKMFCGRDAKFNGGTASFTTTIMDVFLDNPCKQCLTKMRCTGDESHD